MALIAYANERNLYVIEKKEQIVSSLPTSHKLYLKNDIGKSNVIDLFTKEKTNCDILEFENIRDTYSTRKEKGGFCVPYIEQLLIEQPNFFDVNNEEYSVLTFDIETWTRGMGSFPNPNIDPITIISYKYNNEPTQVINLFDEKEKDKFILEEFFNVIKRYDPNIIIGYNCLLNKNDGFDIPYLIKRAQINSLDYKVLGRFGQDPCWTNKEGVITYNLYGRVVFDVLNQVKRDQKIEGTWDRKLKTIAEFYGFKPFKWEDIYTKETSLDMLKDERYIEHVKSDVDSTYGLFEIYYNTSTAVSNLLNIPLGNLIEGSSTYPNKIFSGRELHKKRIVPFETNLSRYKKIAPDIITLNAKDKETINIQAALIKCYKEGYHPYVYSVDYRSFYPSTMKTFNISPESVKFIDFKPKTDGVQPIFKRHKGFLEVEIPDENLGYNAHFYIDQSKNGHIKEKFDQFFDLRAKYKQDIKKAKTEMESKRIEANSNAIKVVMNCFSSDTEVYTTTGIKNIKDCELGDLIYTVNLKTQKIEISPVIEKVKGYSEKIYKIHSRNKEFLATGNHHFPVKTENGYELKQLIDIKKDKYYELISHKPIDGEIKNYFSLFDYVDEDEYMYFIPSEKSCHRHEITKNKTIFEKIYKGKYYFVKKKNIKDPELFELKYKGKLYLKSFSKSSLSAWKYNMDDFMELLGWYISEGSLKYNPSKRYENSISYRGECYSVAISQKLFKQEIKDLLLRMNLKHNITIRKDGLNHYVICNKYIYKVFLELGGESSYYKHIDKKLFKLDYTHLQHLHKTLYMGDGDNSNTNRYSTVSKQLANDYAKLLLHIGKIFKIIYDNNDGIYRIFSNRESNNISTTETIQEIDWNDNVYCITVQDNHTILAGRNGKFNWTGQTTYGFEGSGFSYYGDLACAIAITGFARWLITYAINSNIDSVVYSHTDSIYFNEKVDYELLNKKTAELIKNTTGFDSFIEFEEQDSKSGFFYKAGNYILKKQNGKLLYHGVSMKSSKQVRFFSKLTKDFGTAILEERPRNELIEMAKRYYTFSDLSLDDFLQTTNIKRLAPGENAEDLMNSAYYSNPNAMQPALMSRMKNLYNKELMPGDTIDYYKVKYDYKLKYDSVNIVKLRELLNHKNNIIYRIMLGDIDKKNDSALLNDINKLFADKNIISYIKIDANLIQQEIYREIYNKQKITIRKIETICILNRIIFDIVFKEAILTPFVLGGFVLSYEVNSKDELDLEYYRESLVKKLKIFKMDPYSLEISDNIGLDEWGEKVKAAPKKRIVEELSIEERIAEARKAVNI